MWKIKAPSINFNTTSSLLRHVKVASVFLSVRSITYLLKYPTHPALTIITINPERRTTTGSPKFLYHTLSAALATCAVLPNPSSTLPQGTSTSLASSHCQDGCKVGSSCGAAVAECSFCQGPGVLCHGDRPQGMRVWLFSA